VVIPWNVRLRKASAMRQRSGDIEGIWANPAVLSTKKNMENAGLTPFLFFLMVLVLFIGCQV
jgi:hypothetical protein